MSIADRPSSSPGKALFHDLFDDAAMFPPAELAADRAIAEHLFWRADPDAYFIGPLLVPATEWDGFLNAYRDNPEPVDVVVVGSAHTPESIDAGITVVGFEQVSTDAEVPDASARLAVEPAKLDLVEDLLAEIGERRIDGRPVVAKFRTGGTTSSAFPSEEDLAYFVLASFNAGVPFKLTAGLHHAIRHTDASTGFEHHGFLNVMLAVSRALQGGAEHDLVDALAVRDSEIVVPEVAGWSPDEIVAVRSVFLSFGCCGVAEPLSDLRTLGLLRDRT